MKMFNIKSEDIKIFKVEKILINCFNFFKEKNINYLLSLETKSISCEFNEEIKIKMGEIEGEIDSSEKRINILSKYFNFLR